MYTENASKNRNACKDADVHYRHIMDFYISKLPPEFDCLLSMDLTYHLAAANTEDTFLKFSSQNGPRYIFKAAEISNYNFCVLTAVCSYVPGLTSHSHSRLWLHSGLH